MLFWSQKAKESTWVLKEVNYAIDRKRGDDQAPPEIYPVILEGPPVPTPPEGLGHLHFNDSLIYLINPQAPQSVPGVEGLAPGGESELSQ